MARSTRLRVVSCAGLGITIAFVVSSACTGPPSECFNAGANNISAGPWVLQSVNNAPLPYQIVGKPDRLISGYLTLKTTACTGPGQSKGSVVAHYVTQAPGAAAKFKNYAGTYKWDANKLTLRSFGFEVTGTVSGITYTLPNTDLSLLNQGQVTLIFKR